MVHIAAPVTRGAHLTSMDERYSLYERSRMAITDVQLVHVERVLHERGIRSGEEFLKMLDDRTPVRAFFKWRWDTHAKTVGSVPTSFTHDRDCFLEQLSDTIATAYMSGTPDWHARLTAHLQEKHEELDTQFGTYERQYQLNTRDWERVGAVWVVPAQPLATMFARYPLLIDALGEHDLQPASHAIQVHVPTRFTQGGESPWESGRTVLQLTRHFKLVKRQYAGLGIDSMIGMSWLLDASVGRRWGFTIVDSADLPQNIMGTWYQLLNEDGTFNAKRLAHLMEHNVLPYRLKCGFMRIPNRPPHD